MGGFKWTQAERDYLDDFYKAFESPKAEAKFLAGLAEVSGHTRTPSGVHYMAMKMGLLKKECFALPTLREVAAELDVREDTLSKLLLANPKRFPSTRAGKHTFVPATTQDKLEAFYARPDPSSLEGTVLGGHAAEMLGVTTHGINLWLRFGALKGVQDGRTWHVTLASIRRVMYLRERHGKCWLRAIAHELTPTYHSYQARAIAHSAQQRQKRKKTA